jgi:transcriptional regulator with XRE-family HTH domain
METDEAFEEALMKQIRMEMAEREMTQKDLAEAIGIERATLSRYLSRRLQMSVRTMTAIARVFKMSPRELWNRAADRLPGEG